jgi:hypothetical protein
MTSDQMSSFSMHLIAEELKIPRNEIVEHYDEIENNMLMKFFEFASSKRDSLWIHWNMTNINFGFETLEHRYRVLSQKEGFHIEENKRFNLYEMLKRRYGSNYAKDPKMKNLMEQNGGLHRNFLTGSEEVTAFKANEFVKMHNSTMCKVYFFRSVFNKMNTNTLRTNTNQFRYKINGIYQNPIVQLVGIVGVVGTIISLILMVL